MKKKLVAAALIAGLVISGGSALSASADGGKGRGGHLDGILSGLVGNGTLTQSQLDAIKKAIEDKHAAARADRMAKADELQTLITTTIGLDTATITTRLSAGESLGAIAGSKRQALIDALIAFHTKKIDQAVTDGKITAAQATTLKAGLSASVTFFVDRVPGHLKMGKGHHKGHGPGMKGPRGAKFEKGPRPSNARFNA
jgi:hypothetical protein